MCSLYTGSLVPRRTEAISEIVLCDMFNDTTPLGDKIYAIRAPAPTSSPEFLARAQNRTVGIIFNFSNTIGFNRAQGLDNARAFVFHRKRHGTHGSLENAYKAAQEFLAQPSAHEGPLPLPGFEDSTAKEYSFFGMFTDFFNMFMRNLPITSKFVLASITLSMFLLASYAAVLYVQEYMGCVPNSNFDFGPAFNNLCRELLQFQLYVQIHSSKFMELFFEQLKIGFILLAKHIIDYAFD